MKEVEHYIQIAKSRSIPKICMGQSIQKIGACLEKNVAKRN